MCRWFQRTFKLKEVFASKPFDFLRNCWEASLSLWVGNLEEKVLKLRDDDLLEWIKRDLGHIYVQRGVGVVRDY
jgi:hypothetical protein